MYINHKFKLMTDLPLFNQLASQARDKLKEVEPDHELVTIGNHLDFPTDKFNDSFWGRDDPWQNSDPVYVTKITQFTYYLEVAKYLLLNHSIKI